MKLKSGIQSSFEAQLSSILATLEIFGVPFYIVLLVVSRKAFELANTAPGPIFGNKGGFDVEKIKQSKHFGYHLNQFNGEGVKEMVMLL